MRTLLLMAVVCTLLASGTARPTPRLLLQGSVDGVTNGTIANATIANGTNAGNAPATNGTILDTNTTTGAADNATAFITGPLSQPCRAALVDLFSSPACMSAAIGACSTRASVVMQWRLLCTAGVVTSPRDVFAPDVNDTLPAKLPGDGSYVSLWAGASGELGPVAQRLLAQKDSTHLMVYELARCSDLPADLLAAVRSLADQMGYSAAVLDMPEPKPRLVPSSPVRRPRAKSATSTPARATATAAAVPTATAAAVPTATAAAVPTAAAATSTAAPLMQIVKIPITGSHPLLNYARLQTVHVTKGDQEGAYNFNMPSYNSLVINTTDSAFMSGINTLPGMAKEDSQFNFIYSSESAGDAMSLSAEASFTGYGVGVSAGVQAAESKTRTSTDMYLQYWARRTFEPDTMMMFGNGNDVPLTDTYKQALYAAAAQGEAAVQATYPVFGSHVLLGFTRAIRVVSKVAFRFSNSETAKSYQADISASYSGVAADASAAVSLLSTRNTASSEARLQAGYDSLPQGSSCTLPSGLTDFSKASTDAWLADTQTKLNNCAASIGWPTTTQGDITHAILVPIAALQEFQATVYAARQATDVSRIAPELMNDLVQLNTDSDMVFWINKLYGRSKALQRMSGKYANTNPTYNASATFLAGSLVDTIRANVGVCSSMGCPTLAAALAGLENTLTSIEAAWFGAYPQWMGSHIRLRGGKSDGARYCSDDVNGMMCDRTQALSWESFEVVKLGDGQIALRGARSGYKKWCSVDADAAGPVSYGHRIRCDTPAYVAGTTTVIRPTSAERFQVVEYPTDLTGQTQPLIALRSRSQAGKFCTDDVNGYVGCHTAVAQGWEKFYVDNM